MTLVIIGIIVITILQFILCHISLWIFLAIIGRFMFCLRSLGATMKVKHCLAMEGVAFGFKILWNMLFDKGNIPWKNIGLFLLCSVIVCAFEIFDDFFYVYITDDDEDYYADLQNQNKPQPKETKSKRKVKKTNAKMSRNRKDRRDKRNRLVKGKNTKRRR